MHSRKTRLYTGERFGSMCENKTNQTDNHREEGTMNAAEKMANEVLETYWKDPGEPVVPVDPVKIARAIGINVYKSVMEPDVSGYIIKRGEGIAPDIFFNSEHAPVRQRFTTAHELGHYFKRRQMDPPECDKYFLKRAQLAACGTNAEEIYANQFAAALLMPEEEIRMLDILGFTDLEMANECRVSLESLELRKKKLGIR